MILVLEVPWKILARIEIDSITLEDLTGVDTIPDCCWLWT